MNSPTRSPFDGSPNAFSNLQEQLQAEHWRGHRIWRSYLYGQLANVVKAALWWSMFGVLVVSVTGSNAAIGFARIAFNSSLPPSRNLDAASGNFFAWHVPYMLLFCLIARQDTPQPVVLAEYSESHGNFPSVSRMLLPRIPADQEKLSYAYDRFTFHAALQSHAASGQRYIFLAMTDQSYRTDLAHAFLAEVGRRFLPDFAQVGRHAIAMSLATQLTPFLAETMGRYNEQDALTQERVDLDKVKHQLAGIQTVLVDSIDKLFARGEKIEILVDRSAQLENDSTEFSRQTRSYYHRVWWQNKKLIAGMAAGGTGLVALFLIANCGLTLRQCL